jgi:hypothetical protein
MDAMASHHLVPLVRGQRALLRVSSALERDGCHNPEPDLFSLLWRCFCKLAWWFLVALAVLRRLRLQVVELRLQANYYRSQHQRAVQREADLAAEVQRLQAEIRELKRRLYGRKSETSAATKPKSPANGTNGKARARGQQRGSKGHGRSNHEHLPSTPESCVLPKDQQCCAVCGEAYAEIPGCATGDILEIEVRAHRRRYFRQRYRRQ